MKDDNLTRVQEKLRSGGYLTNPHECAEDRSILAGEYAWVMSQLEDVLQKKPQIWNELRKDVKSDTSCERAWENTPSGIDEMGLRLRAKSIEKMMSALKGLVDLAMSESKNIV